MSKLLFDTGLLSLEPKRQRTLMFLIKPINADRKSDLDRLKEKFCAFDIVFQATIKRIKPDKGRKSNKNNVRITFERSDKERVAYSARF